MLSIRFPARLLLAVVLMGGLVACEQPNTTDVNRTEEGVLRLGSVEAVDTLTRAVSPSGRPLNIEGVRGAVTLRGTDETTAQLRFVRRGRGTDGAAARQVLDELDLTESGSEEGYTYTLERDGGAYAAVDVTGTVPRETTVALDRTTGTVSVAGIEGPLTVQHENGPVSIRGAAASVTVEVKNGDIDVQCASLPPDAEIMLRTVNGDVTLRLPPEASAQIGAETSVGAVRTQGLSLSKQNFAPQDAGGKYNAQLGEGEAAVDLQTKNGDILIAAPDTGPVESSADEPAQEAEGGGVPGLSVPPSDTTITPEEGPDTTEMPSTRADTAAATRADTAAADTSQVSEE